MSSDLHAGDVPAALIDARVDNQRIRHAGQRRRPPPLRTRSGAATDRRGHRPPGGCPPGTHDPGCRAQPQTGPPSRLLPRGPVCRRWPTSAAATAELLRQPELDVLVGDSVGRILAMTPSLTARLGRVRGLVNDVLAMPRGMTERRWREFGDRGWWQGCVRLRDQKGATWESETTTWALWAPMGRSSRSGRRAGPRDRGLTLSNRLRRATRTVSTVSRGIRRWSMTVLSMRLTSRSRWSPNGAR